MKKKLTVIFTGCYQVGVDAFADVHKTVTVELTEEQQERLKPPEGMAIREAFLEDA